MIKIRPADMFIMPVQVHKTIKRAAFLQSFESKPLFLFKAIVLLLSLQLSALHSTGSF
jgi:hypothetical protein